MVVAPRPFTVICIVLGILISAQCIAADGKDPYEKALYSLHKLMGVQGKEFLDHWRKIWDPLEQSDVQLDQVYDRIQVELQDEMRAIYKDKERLDKLKPHAMKLGRAVSEEWYKNSKQVENQLKQLEKEEAEMMHARKFKTRREWAELIENWVRERETWENLDHSKWAAERAREVEEEKKEHMDKDAAVDKVNSKLNELKRSQVQMEHFKETLAELQKQVQGIKTSMMEEHKELRELAESFKDALLDAKKMHNDVMKTHTKHQESNKKANELLERAHSQVFYTGLLLCFALVVGVYLCYRTRDTLPYIGKVMSGGKGGSAPGDGYRPVASGGSGGREMDSLRPMRVEAGLESGEALGDIDDWNPRA